MPRSRVPVFITPAELCALLADEAPKSAAAVYCRVEQPTARLVNVDLGELAQVVEREQVRELYLTLPSAGPDYDQDWHFQQRNRKLIVRIELGATSETVEPTTISTDPDGPAMVVLRAFERAVSRLCHKYVRVPHSMKLQQVYWSPALAERSLRGFEPVLDDVAKVERAAAAAKRKPKWKLRDAPEPTPKTLRREGKRWYGAGIDDLRAELVRFSQANGFPAEVFFQPTCSLATISQSCGRASEQVAEPTCDCELEEQPGQLLVGGSLFPGSEDLRWVYVGWRAPVCGLLRVCAHWRGDGTLRWPELISAWR